MIEELIKRLQDNNLSEQEEQKLNIELAKAQELLINNQNKRRIKELKLQKLKEDEDKTKKLNELDAKILDKKKELKKLQSVEDATSIASSLLILISVIGLIAVAINFVHNFALSLLLSFISVAVGLSITAPFVVKHGKKITLIENKIKDLEAERNNLVEEININKKICLWKNNEKQAGKTHKKSNTKTVEYFEEENINSI